MHSYLYSPSPRRGALAPALSVAPRISGAVAVAVRKMRRGLSICVLLFDAHLHGLIGEDTLSVESSRGGNTSVILVGSFGGPNGHGSRGGAPAPDVARHGR